MDVPVIYRCLRLLPAVLAAVCIIQTAALAQDPLINSVTPASVMQGDTIMLTVTGKHLPTGTVVAEFFPQQIAVLKVLSSTSEELLLQIKVPSLASPGNYNLIIYNHLGQEAFMENAISVGSDLLTPIFDDFDPKRIASATDGFALMLTGSLITQEAVQQLKMDWEQDGRRISGITTAFALAGSSTVVCAVSGRLRSGILRGKVLLGETPIFFVEVTLALEGSAIIGHSPSVLDVMQEKYRIRLVGSEFTRAMAASMLAELNTEKITVRATEIEFMDLSSIDVTFDGPLPSGVYSLDIVTGGNVSYSGDLILEQGAQPDELLESLPEQPDDSILPPETPDSTVVESTDTSQPGSDTTPGVLPGLGQPEVMTGLISGLSTLVLSPGESPVRIDVETTGLSAAEFEALMPDLTVGGQQAELMLVSTGAGAFTYVFAPDASGWEAGEGGWLQIYNPQNGDVLFSSGMAVSEPQSEDEPDTPTIRPAPVLESATELRVMSAVVVNTTDSQRLSVSMAVPPGESLDGMSAEYSLLPLNSELLDQISNITLSGSLELTSSAEGSVTAAATGAFVSGDLLVKIRTADGNAVLNSLVLNAPAVTARATAPDTTGISLNPATGAADPSWLSWNISFGPFAAKSAELVTVSTEPVIPESDVLIVRGSDGTVTVEVELYSLVDQLKPGDQFRVRLDSPIELSWDGRRDFMYAVSEQSGPAGNLWIAAADGPVAMTNDGFVLRLEVDESVDPDLLESTPAAESSLMLLQWNFKSFELETQFSETLGGRVLELRFVRDQEKLQDEAYGYFVDELVESSPVGIKLVWPDSGLSHSFQVDFTNDLKAASEPLSDTM